MLVLCNESFCLFVLQAEDAEKMSQPVYAVVKKKPKDKPEEIDQEMADLSGKKYVFLAVPPGLSIISACI